jgi:dTMP kinase
MLIVYEGIDGSGKTTSSRALCQALERRGEQVTVVQWTSFQPRPEEENSLFGAAERNRNRGQLGPLAYSVWHCADFAYRLEKFALPALKRGEIVIMDRYKYTGFVRDVIRGVDEQIVRSLYTFAPEPDLVIYLDVDPSVAYARKKVGGAPIGFYERALDMFENLDEEAGFAAFQSLCRRRYPAVLPPDALQIDASRASDAVSADILRAVDMKLLQR